MHLQFFPSFVFRQIVCGELSSLELSVINLALVSLVELDFAGCSGVAARSRCGVLVVIILANVYITFSSIYLIALFNLL